MATLVNQLRLKFFLILCLCLLMGPLISTACQNGNQKAYILQTYPAKGQAVGAYGFIGVAFAQTMDAESVEKAFSLSPSVEGEIIWQDTTFFFRPIQALKRNVNYRASLKGNLSTLNGQTFSINLHWRFTARQPDLLFYVPMGEFGEIWCASSDGSHPRQLSQMDGKVFDFVPNRSGDQIVFSAQNEDGGLDLWVMDRDGDNQRILIDCKLDFCSEPTWSMDQTQIAYTRESFLPETAGYQPARVWIATISTAETAPLLEDEAGWEHSPSFSPDGKRLAFYDDRLGGISIIDLHTHQQEFIPSSVPGSGDWSPDGSKLVFTDSLVAPHEPFISVHILDIETLQVTSAFNEV
ncbi:MAG: Ig-like domain-containing protein, partial [Anaerolineales bacterium]